MSLALLSYAADWHGQWWQWLAAAITLMVVGRVIVVAAGRAERDRERLRELDLLELAWKSHVERPRR